MKKLTTLFSLLGERIKPNYITQHFPMVLEKHGMRKSGEHPKICVTRISSENRAKI